MLRSSLVALFFCARILAQPIVGGAITQPSSGGGGTTLTIANASSTGTTTNTLTKLTGAPSTAVITATTDTGGVVGICSSGCSTTGNATIQITGLQSCVFDSSGNTAGHYVKISTVTAGDCADAGATYPTGGQVIGRSTSTNVGAGTYTIDLFPAEIQGGVPGAGASFFSSTTQAGPSNSNTETSLVGTVTGSKTIPANTFTNGQVLQAIANGFYSLPAIADSLTLKMKCGSTVLGSASFTPGAGVVTNGAFKFELNITAIGTGASGAFITNGIAFLSSGTALNDAAKVLNTSNVSFDFTTSCAFDITAQWGAAQSGESITGTNASAWIPGAPVTSVNGSTGAVNTSTRGTFASRPSCGSTNNGATYYSTDIPDFSQCNGTSWQDFVRGIPATLPSAATFSTFGGPTITTNGMVNVASPTSTVLAGEHQTAPATPYTAILTFRPSLPSVQAGSFAHCGIEFDNGTAFSEIDVLQNGTTVSMGLQHLTAAHYTNGTTFAAGLTLSEDINVFAEEVILAATDDGTNRVFWWVPDWSQVKNTTTWISLFSESRTTFLTATNVGFFCDANGSSISARMIVEGWTVVSP